ncbi:MAG: hypothetical protein WAW17_30410 [Rhodococcus sp. (in: high G+C Gram-positive bacteria)]
MAVHDANAVPKDEDVLILRPGSGAAIGLGLVGMLTLGAVTVLDALPL